MHESHHLLIQIFKFSKSLNPNLLSHYGNKFPITWKNVKYGDTIRILCPTEYTGDKIGLGRGVKSFSLYLIDITDAPQPIQYSQLKPSLCNYQSNSKLFIWQHLNTCSLIKNQNNPNLSNNPDRYDFTVEQAIFSQKRSFSVNRTYSIIAHENSHTQTDLAYDIDVTQDYTVNEITSWLCVNDRMSLNFKVLANENREDNPTEVVTPPSGGVKPDSENFVEITEENPPVTHPEVSPISDPESGSEASILSNPVVLKILAITGLICISLILLLLFICLLRKRLSKLNNSKNNTNVNSNSSSNDFHSYEYNEIIPSSSNLGNISPNTTNSNLNPTLSHKSQTNLLPHQNKYAVNSFNTKMEKDLLSKNKSIPVKAEVPKFISREDLVNMEYKKNLLAHEVVSSHNMSNASHPQVQHSLSHHNLLHQQMPTKSYANTTHHYRNRTNTTPYVKNFNQNNNNNHKLTSSQELLANFSTNSPSPVVPLDMELGPEVGEFAKSYKKVTGI